jgi:hypothetical protein
MKIIWFAFPANKNRDRQPRPHEIRDGAAATQLLAAIQNRSNSFRGIVINDKKSAQLPKIQEPHLYLVTTRLPLDEDYE